jgi:hypothetical protein
MSYAAPRVEFYEEARLTPLGGTDTLPACVVGGHAHLVRFDDLSERELGRLGAYDRAVATAYAWPGRPAGAVVDPDTASLHVLNGRLRYFEDAIGSDLTITPVVSRSDRIQISGTAGLAAGNGFSRLTALGTRDVTVGDRVLVRGPDGDGGEAFVDTYVAGIEALTTAASVGAAVAASGNGTTRAASAVVTRLVGTSTLGLQAILDNYSAWADGTIDETYTVTVLQGSVGGDMETARLRITSASGRDNVVSATPADVDEPFAVGARGLMLRFTESATHASSTTAVADLIVGDRWEVVVHDDYKAIAATAAGTYAGDRDTTYVVSVTRGGLFNDPNPALRPQIAAVAVDGSDASDPITVTAVDTAIAIGTKGVTVAIDGTNTPLGLRKGDQFAITCVAAGMGRLAVLRLGNPLPVPLRTASDLHLELSVSYTGAIARVRDGLEGVVNFTAEVNSFEVAAGITVRRPGFDTLDLELITGILYCGYTAWRSDYVGRVLTVEDGRLSETLPGPIDPANPVKYAALCAQAHANGVPVRVVVVADPRDIDTWSDAFDLISGRDDVHGIVPLSEDPAVQALAVAHVESHRQPGGRDRRAWLVNATRGLAPVVESAYGATTPLLATLADDPLTPGAAITLLEAVAGTGQFVERGVRAGDQVRCGYTLAGGVETYTTYVVDAVRNEDTLALVSGPTDPVTVASRIEIWRDRKGSELAEAVAQASAAMASELVSSVWPPAAEVGSVTVPGWALTAAWAGAAAGVVPQQSLTNFPLSIFTSVAMADQMRDADLETMAIGGTWVTNRSTDGEIVCRRGFTTLQTAGLKYAEESHVRCVHVTKRVLLRFLRIFRRGNATPTALALIKVEVSSALSYMKQAGTTPSLGPLLIDGSIVSLQYGTPYEDTVDLVLDLDFPLPINRIRVYMQF